jgi:cyclophilin family peptidyl-prolyl cis-trans isomerase
VLVINRTKLLSCFIVCWLILQTSTQAGFAKGKLDQDLVPPDITLPTGSQSPASTSPGVSSRSSSTSSPQSTGTAALTGSSNAPSSGPAPPPTDPSKPDPLALIETDKGTIVIRLFRQLAPRTVANFIDIAGTGFYNNTSFHRVEPGFCIQGGDPRGDGSGVYFEPNGQVRLLSLETSPSLKHNTSGVVAMAHFPRNPDTVSCQFYITLSPQPSLDGQYSIFGGVVNGMDVVNSIAKGDKIKSISVREQ